MKAEDLISIFSPAAHSVWCKKRLQIFSLNHAEHYQVCKNTVYGGISSHLPRQSKVSASAGKIFLVCSVVTMAFLSQHGRVSSGVFLSYLCRPCCCVSAWKMTLVMPAHPSLPLSLRKPASSS